jgi:hypothetical protein
MRLIGLHHLLLLISMLFRLPLGRQWAADINFNTGESFVLPDEVIVPNTQLQKVYLSERFQVEEAPNLRYEFGIPADPGAFIGYRVKLHFAEIYIGALGPGLRVFSVHLQVSLCNVALALHVLFPV